MSAPNLKEIENGIYELEHEESSKSGYALLAALYTCRDKMRESASYEVQPAAYSEQGTDRNPLGVYGSSDFLQAIAGKDPAEVWPIMDELMDTLQAVNPRAYFSVMRKVQSL